MIVRPTTGNMSLCQETAAEHVRRLEAGDITSVELTEAYLERIQTLDGRVGAFLRVDRDHALAQAADVDKRRAAGKSIGRLAGLPIATHLPLMANSDHANFAANGIPALRLIAGFNAPNSNLRLS